MEERKPNPFDNKHFGTDRKTLAALNPCWLSDTCVWTDDFYIMYNMYGTIEECGMHKKLSITHDNCRRRINPPTHFIRPASELEKCALKAKVQEEYGVDPYDCTEEEINELLKNKNTH